MVMGERLRVVLRGGRVLEGVLRMHAPDRIVLSFDGGLHVVYRRAIARVEQGG